MHVTTIEELREFYKIYDEPLGGVLPDEEYEEGDCLCNCDDEKIGEYMARIVLTELRWGSKYLRWNAKDSIDMIPAFKEAILTSVLRVEAVVFGDYEKEIIYSGL